VEKEFPARDYLAVFRARYKDLACEPFSLEGKVEKGSYRVGDVIWRKAGYCYQKATITAIDERGVMLGAQEAGTDELLPVSTFVVADNVVGIIYAASIYEYLVFRTSTSDRFAEMDSEPHLEGLYVERSIGDGIVRRHFPGHPTGKADILRLLARLEEEDPPVQH
jgi:hypothetical protein